jgi:hypothetical protein
MSGVTPEDLLAAELDELALKIARIRPQSHTNPEAFYEDRSDVAEAARRIARRLRAGRRPIVVVAITAEIPGVR